MVFAQMNNNVIINTITLDNENTLNLFNINPATGTAYDSIRRIDSIYPQPGIGWIFNGVTFTSPEIEVVSGPVYGTPEFFQLLVSNAMSFGNSLIIQIAAQNVALGITQAGKTLVMIDYTQKLVQCLITGSLYEAINQINILITDNSETKTNLYPFITDEKLTSTKYQIQDWLGIPHS